MTACIVAIFGFSSRTVALHLAIPTIQKTMDNTTRQQGINLDPPSPTYWYPIPPPSSPPFIKPRPCHCYINTLKNTSFLQTSKSWVLVLQVAKHMIKNEIRLIYVFRSTLRPLFLPIISKLLIISTFCSYQKINYSSTDKHQTVQTIL